MILKGDDFLSQSQDNFKRGTAELLILHLLQEEDMYGYQITQLMAQKSEARYTMLEGSMYTILFRLMEGGYISSHSVLVGKKRIRNYYHLEEKGKTYYREMLNEYDEIIKGVSLILDR